MKVAKKNYTLSFFLYFLVFGVLIEIITIALVYAHSYYYTLEEFDTKHQLESSIKKELIKHTVFQAQASIKSIIKSKIFITYINNKDNKNKKLVQDLFLSLSYDHKPYMQIRYIDKNGIEDVRVDRNPNPTIIKDNNLQNKSKRYYFKETMGIKNGTFWYSNLDLNVEKGKIEIPHKPTLRIASPFYLDGENMGIIIINLSMKALLSQLVKSYDFNINLIDKNGNYIYSHDEQNSWSVDLKNGKNFLKDHNFSNFSKEEFKKHHIYLSPISHILTAKQKPFIIFSRKVSIIEDSKEKNLIVLAWISLIVLLLSMPIAYFISNIPLTLQKSLRNTLRSLRRFSNIVDKYVLTLIITQNGNIKSASSSFCKKTGYNKNDLIGKHFSSVLSPKNENIRNRKFYDYLSHHKELEAILKDGNMLSVEHTTTPTIGEDGNIDERTIILVDISKTKEMEKKTLIDPLTGLYNRAGIDKYLLREMKLVKRYKAPLSAIMLDIDFFKKINDTFGHQAGDSVLKELSNILKSTTRETDVVGRFGGEEFLIILPQTGSQGALILAKSLRQRVESFNFSINSPVTISLGVSSFSKDDDAKSFIERSDKGLYEAKNNGRNRVCLG